MYKKQIRERQSTDKIFSRPNLVDYDIEIYLTVKSKQTPLSVDML